MTPSRAVERDGRARFEHRIVHRVAIDDDTDRRVAEILNLRLGHLGVMVSAAGKEVRMRGRPARALG